jgi:hypothetical protein
MVVVDAAQVGFTWSRWERGSAGMLAVFRYRIPQERSHYSVGINAPFRDKGDAEKTAYHGEVAIDPSSGTILRLTVQAEQPLSSLILQGDIMVKYGPVEIGGKIYTCPVRSVSIGIGSMGFTSVYPFTTSPSKGNTTLLNDMTFDNYHQFRSESRILSGIIPTPAH